MKITFDERGLITPKEIIEISLEELERIFVEERTGREHRAKLFRQYLAHNEEVEQQIGNILFQFVNGSFTTLKEKPKDIDVVSFIHYKDYRKNEKKIKPLIYKWEDVEEIDGFIAPRSFPGHPHFIESQLSYEYWKSLFSFTKKMEFGVVLPKGLIKINFNER